MNWRFQTFLTGLLALLALGAASANPTSGGYQLFEPTALERQNAIQLASLGNFDTHAKVASECCNASNSGAFDFNRGRTTGNYDAINPGPLDDNLAGTFSGGRYNEVVLTEDVVLHRAGTADAPLGQFFTQGSPQSVIQTRIDSAVIPQWPGGGTSPIDSAFEVRIPAGTKVYVGEVSSQGGAFVGGTQQIVVPKPWTIEGVQVVGSSPLQ